MFLENMVESLLLILSFIFAILICFPDSPDNAPTSTLTRIITKAAIAGMALVFMASSVMLHFSSQYKFSILPKNVELRVLWCDDQKTQCLLEMGEKESSDMVRKFYSPNENKKNLFVVGKTVKRTVNSTTTNIIAIP
ncbi:MAG: hypothetical protein AAB488_00505 [Patescibacteria group bacterium]